MHLTDAQKRAYVIADNKLAENAGWDADLLRLELGDLADLNFDVVLTGFDFEEILFPENGKTRLKPVDILPPPRLSWVLIGIPIVRFGEIQDHVDSIALLEDVIVQTTVTD